MKNVIKSIISVILVLSIMMGATVIVFAESSVKEEYISDIRLIYAATYDEAKLVLNDGKFEEYKVLNNNLNSNTGKTGVWMAYKTTNEVNDAITDIAVMQMGGGYSTGNYQKMIENSRNEYLAMGKIYLDAIDYFAEAYDAEHFLSVAAYRQLNFYAGLDKYKTERLGDLFVDGVLKDADLATLFFEGNVEVTDNVRRLLALGVSYNEDGKHYLEKVGESAKKMEADATVFDDEGYNELAGLIATSIPVFKNMFEELSAYEAELDYENEEVTDLEIKYAESKSIAERMRAVEYLGGKSLYDFCLEYTIDKTNYSSIYPLVDALNDGQKAMAKTLHYYDVVRYSMTDYPEELINSEIAALEEQYTENAIDVYLGVDRTLYSGSFALTSAASRADAYTDSSSLADALFGKGALLSTSLQIASGAVGVGLAAWAIARSIKGADSVKHSASIAANFSEKTAEKATKNVEDFLKDNYSETLKKLRGSSKANNIKGLADISDDVWDSYSYTTQFKLLKDNMREFQDWQEELIRDIESQRMQKYRGTFNDAADAASKSAGRKYWIGTGAIYLLSAAALAYSAISLYKKIHDHYNPKYDEIPPVMVDLVKTADGDRYVKYEAVLDATLRDGKYHTADLNAFEGERWNALYVSKSSEAGKPLLADFEVSNDNNRADEGYLAVHRFGEVVCYDLNKYNFSSSSDAIFMTVRQSENLKSDVTDVPDVVGSIFGAGFWLIAGGAGVLLGVGGTVGVMALKNKKKKNNDVEAHVEP